MEGWYKRLQPCFKNSSQHFIGEGMSFCLASFSYFICFRIRIQCSIYFLIGLDICPKVRYLYQHGDSPCQDDPSRVELSWLVVVILLQVPISEVHILAHSMGNRALIKATGLNPSVVLKNVILAAADEELSKFQAMLVAMGNPSSVCSPLILSLFISFWLAPSLH